MAPVQDWNRSRYPIAKLIKGLSSTNSQDELQSVRLAITHAVLSGQTWTTIDPSPRLAKLPNDTSPTDVDRGRGIIVTDQDLNLADSLRPSDNGAIIPQRVILRPSGVNPSSQLFVHYDYGINLVPVTTLGPIVDSLGRRLNLDIFKETAFRGLRQGFFINTTTSPTDQRFVSSFGACTLWIPAASFAAGVPPNSFFGLRVSKGTVSMPPVNATTVTVELARMNAWAGPNSSRFSVSIPSTATFTINGIGGALRGSFSTSTTGALAAFGSNFNLRYDGGTAQYDASAGSLKFPLVSDASSITVTDVEGDLVHFSGTTQLTQAAWSLPLIVFPTQGQFSEVAGSGGISLALRSGLRSRFLDDRDTWTYGDVELTVDESTAMVSGISAWSSASRNLGVWLYGNPQTQGPSLQARRSTLALKAKSTSTDMLKPGFPFRYSIQANGQESWTYFSSITAALASPVTVNGTRAPFAGTCAVLFTRQKPGFLPLLSVESRRAGDTGQNNRPRNSYVMDNMLLSVSTFHALLAYGQYSWSDYSIVAGTVTLPSSLFDATPILPDPYASNIRRVPSEFISSMQFQLGFDGIRNVNARVQLPPSALGRVTALDQSPFDMHPNPDGQFKLPASRLHDVISAPQSGRPDLNTMLEPWLRNEPALLDISSNASQLGVSFSPDEAPLTVRDMVATVTASKVKVFCLPAVQWEVVHLANPAPAQPQNVTYPSTGIGTKIITDSVTLVPISPTAVLVEALASYQPVAPDSRPISVGFQLPFGMVAVAKADKAVPDRAPKEVKLSQPVFQKEVSQTVKQSRAPGSDVAAQMILTGGAQASFRSPSDEMAAQGFSGVALLPDPNLVPVPGFIADQFNLDFANTHQMVPITDFDISGYGASMFSTWQPLKAPDVGISKVAMDVILGRTAREVVQMSSVIYPFGIRVIRSVTISRLNNGQVEARDSGWLAASDGSYDFGTPVAGQEKLKVHPGLVKGVKQVTNIREVEHSDNLVAFDCYMDIEGAEGGLIPAQGQVGYVVKRSETTNVLPAPLADSAYDAVLRSNVLGGPVNAIVKLGNSQQRLRVSRVLAGHCQNQNQGSRLEFPMELWGTPIVPGSGQWAFVNKVQKELGKLTHEAVDSWGVPLVREGLDVATSAVQNAIRIANAGNLFSNESPFSLIHSADSHRLMFPSPELVPGDVVTGLTSKLPPVLADGFALATSKGIFPEKEVCMTLEQANKVLDVLDGGHYEYKVLEDGAKLVLENAKRTLRKDGNFESVIETAGKILPGGDVAKTTLDLAVSTVTGVKAMTLEHLNMVTKSAEGELNRVVGSVVSSVEALPVFQDVQHLYGDALASVQKVVDFLNKLKILPPLKVSMTNEWAMEISTSMGLDDLLQKLGVGETAAAADAIKKIIKAFNFAMKARTTPTSANFIMTVDVTVNIPTGLGPSVLGVGGFKLKAGTDGAALVELTLGAGIGVEMQVGPFGASAYYTQSQSIIFSEKVYGVAATCVLKVHVSLVVATADLLLEARLGLIGGPCSRHTHLNNQDTIFAYAQVRIALHVSIFLVINCNVDEEAEWKNKMNDGPCELIDMLPMP